MEEVIPNLDLSINQGGIAPFSTNESTYYQIFKTLAEDMAIWIHH